MSKRRRPWHFLRFWRSVHARSRRGRSSPSGMSFVDFETGASVANAVPNFSNRRCSARPGRFVRLPSNGTTCRAELTTSLIKLRRRFPAFLRTLNEGAYPKELLAIGLREYREIFFKPYRIIYRVVDENVYVNGDC